MATDQVPWVSVAVWRVVIKEYTEIHKFDNIFVTKLTYLRIYDDSFD